MITDEALEVTRKGLLTIPTPSLDTLEGPKIEEGKEKKGDRGEYIFLVYY